MMFNLHAYLDEMFAAQRRYPLDSRWQAGFLDSMLELARESEYPGDISDLKEMIVTNCPALDEE